jgi:hypothetical protein
MVPTDETATVEAPQEIVTRITLGSIIFDRDTQARVTIDKPTVDRYVKKLVAGEKAPPIEVYGENGTAPFRIGDGHHRYFALQRFTLEQGARLPESAADAVEIDAVIHRGGKRDAILHAVGANDDHGLPLSTADKRKAVSILLADEEWSTWSDREIGRRCKVDHKTVAAARRELSGEIPQMQPDALRTVQRNGTTYTMATADIGKRVSAKTVAPQPPTTDARGDALRELEVAARALERAKRIFERNCPPLSAEADRAMAFIAYVEKAVHVRDFAPPPVWIIRALHVAGRATVAEIAKAASVTEKCAQNVLTEEEAEGFAIREGDVWSATPTAPRADKAT